ncbi:unnamed protein product, partial [Brassica oleracea]
DFKHHFPLRHRGTSWPPPPPNHHRLMQRSSIGVNQHSGEAPKRRTNGLLERINCTSLNHALTRSFSSSSTAKPNSVLVVVKPSTSLRPVVGLRCSLLSALHLRKLMSYVAFARIQTLATLLQLLLPRK